LRIGDNNEMARKSAKFEGFEGALGVDFFTSILATVGWSWAG
jgi:hypothetical protein